MTMTAHPEAPVPETEVERLIALYRYRLLDTAAEESFDRLTRLTAAITNAPRVQLNLIDAKRQWAKSTVGIERHEAPRSLAFCAHTILGEEVLSVPDARLDPRFANHPDVLTEHETSSIRFYAGAPLRTSDGHNLGALCIIDREPRQDLDAAQRLMLADLAALAATLIESRLETYRRAEAERLKDEFIATVTHELRTPLTSLQGALKLVESGVTGALPEKAARLIGIASGNAQRLTVLIDDVLDLERGEAGCLQISKQPTDLRRTIDEAVLGLEPYAGAYHVRFIVSETGENRPVQADPGRLQQVLANLLSNAIKYSPPCGRVGIKLEFRPADVLISVIDTGPGIPQEFQARVFQKFAQADAADDRQKGSGLGLSIARVIVEAHGGTIGFTTKAGVGTTFWFTLPF